MLAQLIKNIRKDLNEANVIKVINCLNNSEIRSIYYEVYNVDVMHLSKLVTSIIYVCIKTMLRKWKGYFSEGEESAVQEAIYLDLIKYLKENLNYLTTTIDENIEKCESLDKSVERVSVELACPYKKLKTLFYSDNHPTEDTIINEVEKSTALTYVSPVDLDIKEISNWPFVEVKIRFPNFEITRKNLNYSKYKLVKLRQGYKATVKSHSTKLRYKRGTGELESFPTSFILEYIKQIKRKLNVNTRFPVSYKLIALNAISEFEKDIKLCKDEIDTNTDYYMSPCRYPYVRYLAQSINGTKKYMKYEEQIVLDKNSPNIRLQQTFTPVTIFNLSNFSVQYDLSETNDYTFCIDEDFVPSMIKTNLILRCTLCCVEFFGLSARSQMENHLISEHGFEPDWLCVKCNNHFTMRKLCCKRWEHSCSYVKEVKKKNKDN